MKNVYSYVRMSTKAQAKEGKDSFKRQTDAAEAWCKQHKAVLDTSINLYDIGRSGFTGDNVHRGRLGEFLKLIEKGRVPRHSTLLVESFDRLGRQSLSKMFSIMVEIVNAGVDIVTTGDGKVWNSKSIDNIGDLIYSLCIMSRANEESVRKGEQIKAARHRRREEAKRGKKVKVWTPPWCRFENEVGYVVDEPKAKIVRRIFDEYLAGNGPFRIARMFNAENVPLIGGRKATEWYKKIVRDILLDPRVYGYAHHLDKEGYYPEIISKPLFNKVQNRLTLRGAAEKTGGPVEHVSNLFTSICRCSKCGGVMTKSQTTKTYNGKATRYNYLVCDNAKSGRKCTYKSVPYEVIEGSFLQLLDHPAFYASVSPEKPKDDDKAELLKNELAAVRKQIEKLTNKFLMTENPPLSLVEKLKEFEAKSARLTKELKLATAKEQFVPELPEGISEIKNGLSQKIQEKDFRLRIRQIINGFVKRIDLNCESKSYVVHFCNGVTNGVLFWCLTGENRNCYSFQIFKGDKPKYDPNATIYGGEMEHNGNGPTGRPRGGSPLKDAA